ncbi:MAG: para-aminobenzoate synthetase component 1 [Planctomycetota bacterium]|jgi:para-aminobenzoate synthetase component 1
MGTDWERIPESIPKGRPKMNPQVLNNHRLEVQNLGVWPDFGALLERLAERSGLVALDSAAGEPCDWSWIAFDPLLAAGELPQTLLGLRAWLDALPPLSGPDVPGPFAGGFMGALNYDQGVSNDPLDLPRDPWDSPGVVGGYYTKFFVFDHRARCAYLVTDNSCDGQEREELIGRAHAAAGGASSQGCFEALGELQRIVSPREHCARIERTRELIAQGEIYQANLAHPFVVRTLGDPLQLYLRLRQNNPAPYMAYLRFDGGALLSASPELLLEVEGKKMRTRPIKGTAARSENPDEDARLAAGLLASEKDRAELAMIVDLARNDLGRVALPGSVHVHDFPHLRSYEGVHHLMADVEATLDDDRDVLDALSSVFPGGSITGAPKLRAMEIIGEQERAGRGFFTGSLGFIDRRGNCAFNILIRTMQWRPSSEGSGQLRYHVGGGITWSSDAVDEDRETLIKGAKLAQTLGFNKTL